MIWFLFKSAWIFVRVDESFHSFVRPSTRFVLQNSRNFLEYKICIKIPGPSTQNKQNWFSSNCLTSCFPVPWKKKIKIQGVLRNSYPGCQSGFSCTVSGFRRPTRSITPHEQEMSLVPRIRNSRSGVNPVRIISCKPKACLTEHWRVNNELDC